MLHVHDLDHVEVDWFLWNLDGFDSIDNNLSERVGEGWHNLGIQRSARNFNEEVSCHFLLDGEGVQEAESLHLCKLKAINNVSGVHSLADDVLCLAHQFTDEKNVGCGAVSDNIILSGGSTPNHGCSGVLDLLKAEARSA